MKVRRPRRSRVLGLLLFAAIVAPGPVRAQTDTAAEATDLFNRGKELYTQRDYDHACPMLADSYRLSSRKSTLFSWAICLADQGKTASAWAKFKDYLALAKDDPAERSRVEWASGRETELSAELSTLTISVAPETASLPGLVVKRNETEVGKSAWGQVLHVDPGEHVIQASAPGKVPWTATVIVKGKADQQSAEVPKLADLPRVAEENPAQTGVPTNQLAAAPPTSTNPTAAVLSTAPSTAPEGRGRRAVPFVLAGAGGAALVVSGVTWLMGGSAADDYRACDNVCTQADINSKADRVHHLDLITDISGAVGISLLVAGAVTYVYDRSVGSAESAVTADLQLVPRQRTTVGVKIRF